MIKGAGSNLWTCVEKEAEKQLMLAGVSCVVCVGTYIYSGMGVPETTRTCFHLGTFTCFDLPSNQPTFQETAIKALLAGAVTCLGGEAIICSYHVGNTVYDGAQAIQNCCPSRDPNGAPSLKIMSRDEFEANFPQSAPSLKIMSRDEFEATQRTYLPSQPLNRDTMSNKPDESASSTMRLRAGARPQ